MVAAAMICQYRSNCVKTEIGQKLTPKCGTQHSTSGFEATFVFQEQYKQSRKENEPNRYFWEL